MYAVETQCGVKYFGWLKGRRLYPTRHAAQAAINATLAAEKRLGLFQFTRRVVIA